MAQLSNASSVAGDSWGLVWSGLWSVCWFGLRADFIEKPISGNLRSAVPSAGVVLWGGFWRGCDGQGVWTKIRTMQRRACPSMVVPSGGSMFGCRDGALGLRGGKT